MRDESELKGNLERRGWFVEDEKSNIGEKLDLPRVEQHRCGSGEQKRVD